MRLISKLLISLVVVICIVTTYKLYASKPINPYVMLHYLGTCTDTNEYLNSTNLTAVLLWSEDQLLNQECNQVVIDKAQ